MIFGIYLGYAPDEPINNQGIGRLFSFLVISMLKTHSTIVIACPRWHLDVLIESLSKNKIDLNKIEIITTDKIPFIVKLRRLAIKFAGKKRFAQPPIRSLLTNFSLSHKINKGGKKSLDFITRSTSESPRARLALMAPLLFPVAIFEAITYLFKNYFLFLLGKIGVRIKRKAISFKNRFPSKKAKLTDIPIYKMLRSSIFDAFRKREFNSLNNKINLRSDIYAWYVPSLFWPEVTMINAKKLIAAPDLVYLDFPTLYSTHFFDVVDKHIKETVSSANKLVCYSDYVKNKHLVQGISVPSSAIQVIPHGWINLSEHLLFEGKISKLTAKSLLSNWFKNYFCDSSWFKNFDLSSVDYFFYSSQDRPHKNLLNLVKAYEFALRRKYINCKLVLTAKITNPEVISYITEHKLSYEIIQLYNVPVEILAALNMLAVCAINPSYFEGGFPFTFSEAYSVGTPSIMSDIPVVRELVTDSTLAQTMLFDPTSYLAIAEKMAWAFNNRDLLFSSQKDLAETLQERTWDKVAQEYCDLMKTL